MELLRNQWKDEKTRIEVTLTEEKERIRKEREREEADYIYNRDRERKMEEHDYNARRAALEKALQERQDEVDKDLLVREAIMAGREEELEALQAQVEAFSGRLEQAQEKVRAETEVHNDLFCHGSILFHIRASSLAECRPDGHGVNAARASARSGSGRRDRARPRSAERCS